MPRPLVGLTQDSAGIGGAPEAGDRFGASISMTGYRSSDQTYNSDVLLAVGEPGKDTATVKDAGSVHIFRPVDAAIVTNDRELTRGSGLPGTATARDYTGIALMGGSTYLYAGVPYSKESATSKGVLYVTSWTNADGSTSTGTTTYQPGAAGLPDAGSTFGAMG
ncbi:hypothetical protein [Streptomyces sp. NPDC101234]|uniref:hypothetical protein n=1 Tax=Streptomyces sp. NPDC101234 TaxID=3366138 RepID=UPI0037F1A3E6